MLAAQVPPEPHPVTANLPMILPDRVWRPASVLPIVGVGQGESVSDLDETVETILELSNPQEKHIVSHYYEKPQLDEFVNFWLLSQPVVQDNNEVRTFAYTLNPDDPDSVCSLAAVWGPGLEIVTKDHAWGRTLLRQCPEGGFDVVTD